MNIDKAADQIVQDHVLLNFYDIIRDDIYQRLLVEQDEQSGICQVWAVDHWLAEKLYSQGEAILFLGPSYCLWGRKVGGQEIAMDMVIRRIAEDLSESVC